MGICRLTPRIGPVFLRIAALIALAAPVAIHSHIPSAEKKPEKTDKPEILARDFDAINLGGVRFVWDEKKYGGIITALCQDLKGNVWAGSEDKGVWLMDISGKTIRCVGRTAEANNTCPVEDKIPDIYILKEDVVYALACDKQGRIWAGHGNQGVSVFNGETWKNYDVVSGPLGERINDIKVNPVDGDVWIGTSLGLARYMPTTDTWRYYLRVNGLPSDQISSIAFSPDGKMIYIGTQCDGVATGTIVPAKDEIKWTCVDGPLRMTMLNTGPGLPSGRINEISVSPGGTVYAATDSGFAVGDKTGKNWTYYRGRELLKKAELLYIPLVVDNPKVEQERNKLLRARAQALALKPEQFLFEEDNITTLQVDPEGKVWLGQREKGYCIYAPEQKKVVHSTQDDLDLWGKKFILISKVLFPNNGAPLVALCGKGLLQSSGSYKQPKGKPTVTAVPTGTLPHPATAAAPMEEELQKMLAFVKTEKPAFPVGHAEYLGEDWQTQGDWVGRYGRQFAVLFAVCAPINNYPTIIRQKDYWVKEQMGPHTEKNDSIRYWVKELETQNKNTLYSPVIKLRRFANCDDHGEVYDPFWEGPDMWLEVTVPEGMQQVSLYFANPDAHDSGRDIERNYVVAVKDFQPIDVAHFAPAIAKTRVTNFAGGVYKSFLLRGPSKYWVHIQRNYSINAIVCGYFVDQLKGMLIDTSYKGLQYVKGLYTAPKYSFKGCKSPETALMLWKYILNAPDDADSAAYFRGYRRLCYRSALGYQYPADFLANLRWKTYKWDEDDREAFLKMIIHN